MRIELYKKARRQRRKLQKWGLTYLSWSDRQKISILPHDNKTSLKGSLGLTETLSSVAVSHFS